MVAINQQRDIIPILCLFVDLCPNVGIAVSYPQKDCLFNYGHMDDHCNLLSMGFLSYFPLDLLEHCYYHFYKNQI